MTARWGPADWRKLPAWAAELERQRWMDGRRVRSASSASFWRAPWTFIAWNPLVRAASGDQGEER